MPHSQGLESIVSRRRVCDADGVAQYLHNPLPGSILPAAGVALRNAHAAASDADLDALCEIDRHLYAMKLPEELRLAPNHVGSDKTTLVARLVPMLLPRERHLVVITSDIFTVGGRGTRPEGHPARRVRHQPHSVNKTNLAS